jgi:hypothetical protein
LPLLPSPLDCPIRAGVLREADALSLYRLELLKCLSDMNVDTVEQVCIAGVDPTYRYWPVCFPSPSKLLHRDAGCSGKRKLEMPS